MSLKDDECHPCPVISSLRALAKQVRNFFENYINGPDLVSMSHLPKTHVPEQGKIYLEKGLSNLRYIVKTPKGDVVEGYLDIDVDDELTEKILALHKTEILMETSKRGHIHTNVVVFIKKGIYRAKCYYKRYGIWPFICSLFVMLILYFACSYRTIDNVLCYLMTLVISAVGLAYKAHSDKEQKNKPIFKARRECFDELEKIIRELYFNLPPREEKDFQKKNVS